ncbi:MAG: HNH endonuclease [Acidimicrobiia bacterium]|nr:HNH endonuclease [Acidimicrobiia bacterium]
MSPQQLANADLHAEVLRREKASRADAAERLGLIAEIDRRRSFEDEGFLSTTSWLRDRFRISGGEAKRWVELARRLAELPDVARALAEGDISFDHARLLASASVDHPERFEEDHKVLIDAAKDLSPTNLRQALDYWRQAHDAEASEVEHERRFDRRKLYSSQTLDGMWRIDGYSDPESGAVIHTALNAVMEPWALDPSDERTPAQRRHDALVEITRHYLDSADAPQQGGEKPHLTLLVDLPTLEGRAGKTCELDETGVISPETARRLACDAGVSRVITQGPSEPLDVGRRTRTIPPAIRRALVVRDGGCAAQGCDRPPRWTDAHHKVHWADGGPTSLDNLVLLCRRHHRMAHGP